MPLGHTHMALDGPETNLHIVYASSIIDQHKEEVFEQYDFAGPVASCKVEEVSTDAAAAAARGTGWWPGSRASRRSPRRALELCCRGLHVGWITSCLARERVCVAANEVSSLEN